MERVTTPKRDLVKEYFDLAHKRDLAAYEVVGAVRAIVACPCDSDSEILREAIAKFDALDKRVSEARDLL